MTLIRGGSQPLWTPYITEVTKMVDDKTATPDETGKYPQVEIKVTEEFTTDDLAVLEKKIIELLDVYTTAQIKVIKDVTYTIDLLIV